MTFELSTEHAAVRDEARALAQSIGESSSEIDRTAVVPAQLASSTARFAERDLLTLVLAVEELATANAAVAVSVAGRDDTRPLALTGLRGGSEVEPTPRGQLVLAAAALGIGRAALDEAVRELRKGAAQPSSATEKPHWVAADVATELEAARLLAYKAARTGSEGDIAVARLMASAAATRAVDAAVRIVGAAALTEGSTIERLARDVRAIAVLAGTEEDQRAVAAEDLLPQ
jgi:hypothetical protein